MSGRGKKTEAISARSVASSFTQNDRSPAQWAPNTPSMGDGSQTFHRGYSDEAKPSIVLRRLWASAMGQFQSLLRLAASGGRNPPLCPRALPPQN
jgi:hypothetical protein